MGMYSPREQKFLVVLHCIALVIHLTSSILAFRKAEKLPKMNANITLTKVEYMKTVPYMVETVELVGSTQQPVYWIAWNETITWIAHIAAIIIFSLNRNICCLTPRVAESTRRWGSYAITAGLLQVAMVLSVGPVSLWLILYLMISNGVLQSTGWLIDQTESPFYRIWFGVIGMMLFSVSVTFVAVRSFRISGLEFDELFISYSGLAIIYGLFYSSFGIVQLLRQLDTHCCCITDRKRCCTLFNADGIFVLLSITSKVFLSWSLIGIIETGLAELDIIEPDTNWGTVQIVLFVLCSLVLVGGVIYNWYYFSVPSVTAEIRKKYKKLKQIHF